MYRFNIVCFCGESYFAPSDTEQNLLINFSSSVYCLFQVAFITSIMNINKMDNQNIVLFVVLKTFYVNTWGFLFPYFYKEL